MKKPKKHRGYNRYANLSWWEWQEINEARARELRLTSKAVADAVAQDVKEILAKYSVG